MVLISILLQTIPMDAEFTQEEMESFIGWEQYERESNTRILNEWIMWEGEDNPFYLRTNGYKCSLR